MMGTSHLVLGVVSLVAVSTTGLIELTLLTAATASLGALLPDIDHPGSLVGRKIRPLSDIIGLIFGHRGITHSALAAFAALALAIYLGIGGSALAALAIGYLSHLLGDWLTPSGLPLLWPSKKLFRSPRPFSVRTGGLGEFLFVTALLALTLGITYLVAG